MSEAPPESADPIVGREIAGKYVVERFLGGGAMGAVYKARQVALDKAIAIKVMHKELATDHMFAARFHREAKAASRLDHPNSIRVMDFGAEPDGLLYIAMEYIEGRDLYKVIHEDWPLPKARVVEILSQALAALATAHEMGVIHRDLKPENIMMLRGKSDDGHETDVVKVCDFGIAKINEVDDEKAGPRRGAKLTTQGVVVGTPEYMSPEQAKGEKLDARSDLYAMGVILYQLIVGRVPFEADTPLATVLKHVTDPPPPPSLHYPGVDKSLERIAMRALAKAREERYQSAREMRADLKASLDEVPATVPAAPETAPMLPRVTDGSITHAPTIQQAVAPAPTAPTAAPATTPVTRSAPPPAVTAPAVVAPAATSAPPPPMLSPSSSKVTPLGTETSPAARKRQRWQIVAAVAVAVVLALWGQRQLRRLSGPTKETMVTMTKNGDLSVEKVPATPEPSASAAPPSMPSNVAITLDVPMDKKGPRGLPKVAVNVNGLPPSPSTPAVDPTPTTASPPPATNAPPTAAVVEPPPPTAVAAPTPTPTQAPAPPPFDPTRCRASATPFKSNGAVNAGNLRFDANGVASSCFQRALRDKGAPWSGSGPLTIKFDTSGRYKGAVFPNTMDTLPGLGNCIRAAAGTATLRNLGDLTDAPELTTTLSFTCN